MLTLIGLGANWDSLSFGAWNALRSPSHSRFSRAGSHSALIWLQSLEGGITFDAALDDLPLEEAVTRVLEAARRSDTVIVLPGHPLFGDPLGIPLVEAARLEPRFLCASSPPRPPPADSPADFEALVRVMARLRDPQPAAPGTASRRRRRCANT